MTDADNREVLEYDGSSGAVQRWYAFGQGPDAVINQMNVAAGTRETMIPDIQGSIIGTLNSGGALAKSGYQPYGENPAVITGTYRYTARRFDPETAGSASQPSGLYYYRARMYSPTLGRFLQPDPIGYAGGSNLYAYVGNDPLNNTDPNGLLGILYSVGGTAEAGGPLGLQAAATLNVGAGGFINTSLSSSFGTISNGIFEGSTAFAGVRPFGAGATGQAPLTVGLPAQTNSIVVGAFTGRGESISLTTANNVADVAGPATIYSLNTPIFASVPGWDWHLRAVSLYVVARDRRSRRVDFLVYDANRDRASAQVGKSRKMTNCSVTYDLIGGGYDDWWFSGIGLIAAAFAAAIYGLFRLLAEKFTRASARKGALAALFVSLIWSLVSFVWTYSAYSNLRSAYERGAYEQVSGAVEHFVNSGPGIQPGTVRFTVGNVAFSYSQYVVSPGYRGGPSPLRDGLMVRIRYIGKSIVRLEICGA